MPGSTLITLIILALVSLVEIILALGVLMRNPAHRINQLFAWLTFSFIVWGATSFFDQSLASGENMLQIVAGLPFAGAIGISSFYASLSLYFPEHLANSARLRKRVKAALYASTIPLLYLCLFTDLIVKDITTSPNGNSIVPGMLYPLFALYFLSWIIFGSVNLARKFRHTNVSLERTQLAYVFIGLLVAIAIGFTTNVLLAVVLHVVIASRFGFMATIGMTCAIGYAVIAHHLFNVRLLVARSVAYLLLLATLSVAYFVMTFGAVAILFPDVHLTLLQEVGFVASAIVIASTLPPLKRFFERVTNRLFYRDRYDAQALLDRVSGIFATQLELRPLMTKFLTEISKTMHLVNAQLIVLDDGRIYGQASHGSLPHGPLTADGLHLFKHPLIVTDDMPPGALREVLSELEIRVVLMLRAQGEIVGCLVLGDKQSGEVYADQDLAVLEIMRKELAVAVANAKAYDEIARFNTTLQGRIRDATARLRVANKNLRALDKTKDEFISMASHQLGTPLTAITGYLSMALDNDKHNMTADQREFVGYALEAAEKLVYMSGDMLNVSRLNSGRFTIQRQLTDIANMVRQEVNQIAPAAQRKDLELTVDVPDEPVMAEVDESKTRQVIMNFIDNAIYYTQSGGVHVRLERQARAIQFTVTDTGIGVPPEERPKLFAKFYRAENAKTMRPDGTGLGLYLAKRVIEDQGGRIVFVSEVGRGSTFGFTLPI